MPQIKIERIVSFSSEDPVHVAKNVLSQDSSKKWKCKTAGERTATIVLQLDQPYTISGIDIGNEHSAYIEVLVSRFSSVEDYKVLLVMSSFMTPLESRQSQNINKVRMFKVEDFSEPERNEKWDRIKIVCTQPFNRHVQYGLSFINLNTSDGKATDKTSQQQQQTIGKFIVRPESPDNITVGSIFAKRKEIQKASDLTLKGAAAIRQATSLAQSGSPATKHKIKHNLPTATNIQLGNPSDQEKTVTKPRNRDEILYSRDEEGVSDKIEKILIKKAKEKEERQQKKEKESKDADKKKKTNDKAITPKKEAEGKLVKTGGGRDGDRNTKNETPKRKQCDDHGHKQKKLKKEVKRKPFANLLEGVVLVISGIQNPDRASLRSMALSMGAKYKPDWDNSCTHLVCAFVNTPKFNQVKGKGKIIKRNWVEDCYNQKKRLPWRRYALDKNDLGHESEEEIWEAESSKPSQEPAKSFGSGSDTDDMEMKEACSDTEDRIEQIKKKEESAGQSWDVFNADTEDECVDRDESLPSSLRIVNNILKSFFDDKIFYIDEVFGENAQKKMAQYVVAYKGLLVENLEVSIDIIVTNNTNAKILKDLYPNAVCIAPDWIWECHNRQKLVPMDGYIFD